MADPWREVEGPGGARLPVSELDGGRPGPAWLLAAAVHGDEYEGPEAIRRAMTALSGTPFAGSVIAVPIANPMAYARGARSTPEDGGNLNRSFPGDAEGSLTPRWARWLWERFLSRADRLVDLHAGGVTWRFEPVAGFYRDEDAPLAAAFGLTLWRMPDAPGVLSREFRVRRGPAVGVELGSGGQRDEALTAAAAASLVRIVRGETGSVDRPVYTHRDVLAPADGEWIPSCDAAQWVSAGDALGTISDWTGAKRTKVHTPLNGCVLAVRRLVSVRAGELVAAVGVPEAAL